MLSCGFLIHTYLICIAYNLCSGNIVEEGMERLQGPEGQEFICETVSLRNGCLNKSRTMTNIDRHANAERRKMETHPRQRTTSN